MPSDTEDDLNDFLSPKEDRNNPRPIVKPYDDRMQSKPTKNPNDQDMLPISSSPENENALSRNNNNFQFP